MTAELAIFLPTLYRAHKLAACAQNIIQTTPQSRIYFACFNEDHASIEAVQDIHNTFGWEKIFLLVTSSSHYCPAANKLLQHSTEALIFTGQDDLEYLPGWLETAKASFAAPEISVVSTHDSKTDLVSGWLIKRDYINKASGVCDVPQLLFHPHYRQYFGDTEFKETAKHRGVYADSAAQVIHNNPQFSGDTTQDKTTLHGLSTATEDKAFYNSRIHLFHGQGAL